MMLWHKSLAQGSIQSFKIYLECKKTFKNIVYSAHL